MKEQKLAKTNYWGYCCIERFSNTGRLLANEIVSPQTGAVSFEAETVIDEAMLNIIGENAVQKLLSRGTAEYESDVSNAVTTETITLGAPEEHVRDTIKKSMIREMLGKNTTKAVVDKSGDNCSHYVPLTENLVLI